MSTVLSDDTRARLDDWLDRRKRNRKRLKTALLVLVIAALIPLQWITRRGVRHLAATQKLDLAGANVHYDLTPQNWAEGGESSLVFTSRASFLLRKREAPPSTVFTDLIRVTRIDASHIVRDDFPDLGFLAFTPDLEILRLDRSMPEWPGWPPQPPFGDEATAHLAKLPALRSLDLSGNRITDAGAAAIARSGAALEELDLSNTLVGDAGLRKLRSLRTLLTLKLSGSRVTPQGVAAIRTALPLLDVDYDPTAKPFHRD